MLAEERDLEGDADEKRQKVRAGLRHLHALQAEKMRQDENERQIADALTQRGKHRRRDLEAQALIELVDERGVRHGMTAQAYSSASRPMAITSGSARNQPMIGPANAARIPAASVQTTVPSFTTKMNASRVRLLSPAP